MKLINLTLFFLLIISFTIFPNCEKNKEKRSITNVKNDCQKYLQKHFNTVVVKKNDSALYYVNKAIDCDPTSINYKFTKVKFLIRLKKYEDAEIALNPIKENDLALKMLDGILKLKINNSDSKNTLSKVYTEYNNIENPTSTQLFYKIALDNYFKGKEYSTNKILDYKKNFQSEYEKQNIGALEELILKETKENVLFKLFNFPVE